MLWRAGKYNFELDKPIIVGILNITPDSFSDGNQHFEHEQAYAHANRMLDEGAAIIDVGGESTRPGSDEVSESEELARVLPVIEQLVADGVVISIDTRHAAVAKRCVEAGAAIINDISGFRDAEMRDLAANSDVGCVVMHMLGEPKNMQNDPHYDDVVAEVSDYLTHQADLLVATSVAPERICIDPGPGFGKTFDHNLALLKATHQLAALGYPLMAAYSRKGFIGNMTAVRSAAERVTASALVAAWAANQGARVLRVHDVKETAQALAVFNYLSD